MAWARGRGGRSCCLRSGACSRRDRVLMCPHRRAEPHAAVRLCTRALVAFLSRRASWARSRIPAARGVPIGRRRRDIPLAASPRDAALAARCSAGRECEENHGAAPCGHRAAQRHGARRRGTWGRTRERCGGALMSALGAHVYGGGGGREDAQARSTTPSEVPRPLAASCKSPTRGYRAGPQPSPFSVRRRDGRRAVGGRVIMLPRWTPPSRRLSCLQVAIDNRIREVKLAETLGSPL
jgi:hypothetical protein